MMQLTANKTAKYFINDEYCQVELANEKLIVSSSLVEERIPFSVWDGSVQVKRGIIWGELQFFSASAGYSNGVGGAGAALEAV